jgi:PQQ-like domain
MGIAADGSVTLSVPLDSVVGVAVANSMIYVVGADGSTPAHGRSLLAFDGADPLWRADGTDVLAGAPVVAGGVVFVGDSRADGFDVRAYDAAGCGAEPSCAPLKVIDNGPGTGTTFGLSVTFGTLFVSQPAPGNRLIAYALPTA